MKNNKKPGYIYNILIVVFLAVFLTVGFISIDRGTSKKISPDLKWSERMALSIMQRNPEAWQIEFNSSPKWGYTHGLVLSSFLKLYDQTKEKKYYDYVENYTSTLVQDDGSILTYDIGDFNIDQVNAGNVLLSVYKKTHEEKYLLALQMLREQLKWQPRTSEGGFWHKLRYPWQMWLDGLFMGSPFYTRYVGEFNEPKCYDDIINQFTIMEKHARDSVTGLLYHGWDESHIQRWADQKTGCSKNFWGRAMGWYGMALVDVLENLPEDHPGREKLVSMLNGLVDAIIPYQDESGLWYQVVDKGDKEGNYLEASASCMFAYTVAKGVNRGYLDEKYLTYAQKCYDGIINHLIEVDENGEVHITNVCSVAGLGGDPYRDGSYKYYVSEPKRNNDPKATGPFILASLELNK